MDRVRQFFRARFSKQGDVRFTSHHDLLRLFERALRRADLPVAMSQGYNPRPQISLPAPLSVAVAGYSEVLDFELDRWTRPAEVKQRLNGQLPKGIALHALHSMPTKPDRSVKGLSYRIPLSRGHPVTQQSLDGLLGAEEVIVRRRRADKVKTLNIAPFIRDVRLKEGEIRLLLGATQQGTARPEEVLEALGCRAGVHYSKGAVERTRVSLSSSR